MTTRTKRTPPARATLLGLVASSLLLVACGGGGGGDAAPAAQPPSKSLVWGTGVWGVNEWTAPAAPAQLDPQPATSSANSLIRNAQETSR